jgi:hypothetical protein
MHPSVRRSLVGATALLVVGVASAAPATTEGTAVPAPCCRPTWWAA